MTKKNSTTATKSKLPVRRESAPVMTSPDALLTMAINKDLDIEKLQKLIEMKLEHDRELARKEYLASFSDFQNAIPELRKKVNVNYEHRDKKGETNYNYLDLAGIEAEIKLAKHTFGLSHKWIEKIIGKDEVEVSCVISHKSGHVVIGEPLRAIFDTSGNKSVIHAMGSALSYLRRYTLSAILGLSTANKDDDGRGSVPDQKTSTTKIVMEDNHLTSCIEMIVSGKATLADVQNDFSYNEAQESALKLAVEQCKAQKS